MVKLILGIVLYFFCCEQESILDLSAFPRLPESVLWRGAEALVLVVVVTAAKEAHESDIA